jgi:serine/threonine protein kinase
MKDSVMSSPIATSGTSPALANQLQRDDTASIDANLTERFEILKFLGTTGNSFCFVARDLATRNNLSDSGRLVRLKVLSDDAAVDEVQKQLFYLEAAAAAKLSHENIARTTEAEELGGIHFCTIEQSPNAETLRGLLDIRSWLEIDVAVSIALQLADALDHAHQMGVLHLNLNPANILIESDGRVLVTDFGISSQQELAWAHGERSRRHSLQYSSPEQIQGSHADCRSDLYSAGIILFEMLTDRVPFDAADAGLIKRKQLTQAPHSPQLFRQGISTYLSALVLTLLEKNPDWRFRTATQLQMALSRVADTELAAKAEEKTHRKNKVSEKDSENENEGSLETEYRAIEAATQSAELEFIDPQPESAAPESAAPDYTALESAATSGAADIIFALPDYAPPDDEAEAALSPVTQREFFEPPTITVIDPPPYMPSERKTPGEPLSRASTVRADVRQPSPPVPIEKSRRGRRILGLLAITLAVLLLVSLAGSRYFPHLFPTADSGQQNNLTNALDASDDAAKSPALPDVDQPVSTEQAPMPETKDRLNRSSASASAVPASVPKTPPKKRFVRRAASIRGRQPAQRKLQAKRQTSRPRYIKRGKGWSRVVNVNEWLKQNE